MKKAAFIILYSDGFQEEKCRFLMSSRWNGTYGFIGGIAENEENYTECLQREVKEEIGFNILKYKSDIKLLNESYSEKKQMTIKTFLLKVNKEEIKKIMSTWFVNGSNAEYEIQGLCAINGNSKTINTFLENKFAGTTKEDLLLFLNLQEIY